MVFPRCLSSNCLFEAQEAYLPQSIYVPVLYRPANSVSPGFDNGFPVVVRHRTFSIENLLRTLACICVSQSSFAEMVTRFQRESHKGFATKRPTESALPTSCTTAVTEAGAPSSAVETDTSAPLKTPSTIPLKSTTPAASVGLAAAMLRLPLLVLLHLLLRLPTRQVDAVDVYDRVVDSQVAGLIPDCAGEVSGKLFTCGY
ncbi:hypothetical protein PAAG_06259 [Paracoccidioides lutzii Pb01]|uniref:Uncharacterized protein n=1 Tax=Paracoccidioides lutzii (strain ATCC MYA-826 / Pb01) TaxID=502779 RepID=C1H5R4_PARBA|nr:hypothetical protein PAAG_06259 [Paracoccidioides lutzii Pb01]EEH35212.2 hypothetical protein PAAG_06259 [Paracoccidioides lutzii Pb01]